MYATYHMTNPAVFYNKEDQWDILSIAAEPRAEPMKPYYTIMKLPGEEAPEFIQMLPFTPARKDNLAVAAAADAATLPDESLMIRALEDYRRAMKAQREGQWGLYGEEIRQLREVLERRNKNPLP
jgi:uncharacterized membrane protein (UPF0182 family)